MEEKFIKILNKKDCTGCRACEQICPVSAITMTEDDEGFLTPKINKDKCINCGLCKKTCGQIQRYSNTDKLKEQVFLGIKPKEIDIAKKSTSGGIAYLISKLIIEQNGVVVGSAYDENLMPKQIIVTNIEDLQKIRGSKYVTSDTNNTFSEVKKYLEEGKIVLYTGVPCQIGGLKKFLKKDYENLYTIDIICHGVPSQKIFKKYLKYLENKIGEPIVSYNFRSKNKSNWGRGYCSEIHTTNRVIFRKADFDPYYFAFLQGIIFRESCYYCKYKNMERIGDITLGDLWGIEQFDYKFYDKNGVSLAIINTVKGNKLFENIKDNVEYRVYSEQQVTKFNDNLKHNQNRPSKRDGIYNELDKISFDKYAKKYLSNKNKFKYILKNIMPNNIKTFYKRYLKRGKNE